MVIAESHIALHTWPEKGYAAIDIFTCGPTLALRKAVDYLIDAFKSGKPLLSEVSRGGEELEAVSSGTLPRSGPRILPASMRRNPGSGMRSMELRARFIATWCARHFHAAAHSSRM